MRVYHYLEAKWALDDIRRRRLKISEIADLNDPYEVKSVHSHDPASQLALENTRRQTCERYGVLCYSRNWNNILMWSHYGDKHKGICLGFDVLDELTRPVEYVEEVESAGNLTVEETSDGWPEEGERLVDRLMGAKYKGWSYEQEIRVHVRQIEIDEETGKYFVDFTERLILREVIAGARFPMSKRPIEDALKGYLEDVQIARATCSTERFEVIIDPNGFGS
jgi:hypothetical protein